MESFYFRGLKIEYQASSLFSDRAIVLCPGLPASSKNEDRITTLAQRNFHVFYVSYPGYPGSSKISFLSQNPAELISEFINFLRLKGIHGVFLNRIFLIGSSFGGSVVLDVPNADKIVAISPVIDYKNLYNNNPDHNYGTLKDYLIESGYKINNTGWKKLKEGKLFKLSKRILKRKTLIIYNKNDQEINPILLGKFLKLKGVESICVSSDKHLSFKNIQQDIFENVISFFVNMDGIVGYNDDVNQHTKKFISKILDGPSITLIGGSLASENLVLESDLDIHIISVRNFSIKAKKIKNHKIELTIMNFNDYANYARSNIRGLSKLLSSKLITDSQSLSKKIEKLRAQILKENKEIFLIFQLLEKTRMENIKFMDVRSPLAIKKGVGGRRSLGFMTVTFNVLNNLMNSSFWNTLELMIAEEAITRTDKEYIEYFFSGLIKKDLRQDELGRLLKNNDKIINKYINNYFIKKVNKNYKLGLNLNRAKINVNTKGFIGDLVDAFYSNNPKVLSKLADKYRHYKNTIKRHTIFYFLALNCSLPIGIAEFIAVNFAYEYPMHNVRRNLVESTVTDTDKRLLQLLTKDPDPKVSYYAKKKLRRNNILRVEVIRYPTDS